MLVVEGVSGIGKSTLIDALVRRHVDERPARKLRSLLHLTQAHTYGPLAVAEDEGTLTVAQNLAHLETIVAQLEWQVLALRAERVPKFFAIVDTLHLTHCHRPGVVRFGDVEPIDRRLAALGARLLFVHAEPATLWTRGIEPRRAEQFITGYAAPKWGPSLDDVHRYFVGEQAAMRGHLQHTRMEQRALAVDAPLATYLDEAYQYWQR